MPSLILILNCTLYKFKSELFSINSEVMNNYTQGTTNFSARRLVYLTHLPQIFTYMD